MKIVAVEGPIASGKSTVLDAISKKFPNAAVVHEPVELWENFLYNGVSWQPLRAFYDNPAGGLFRMQLLVLSSMARQIYQGYRDALQAGAEVLIYERTLASSIYIFAKHFQQTGEMSVEDFTMLQYFADIFLLFHPHCFNKFSTIFYLDLDPQQSQHRMQKRGRESERNVKIQYLESLAKRYTDWAYKERFAPLSPDDLVYLDARHDPELIADGIMKMVLS